MQTEIVFTETKTISFEQTQAEQKIFKLIKKYSELQETARYLYGKKKGAWGRTTMADEKRSNQLNNLKTQIQIAQIDYNSKFKNQ